MSESTSPRPDGPTPSVALFVTCVVDVARPDAGVAAVHLLRATGAEVTCPEGQTCCGQPAFNAGFWDESKSVCSKFIKDFAGSEYIVSPSASCVGFVRNYYGKLFENSSLHHEVQDTGKRIYELTDFLVNVLKQEQFGAVLEGKATYHDSCAALRECKIKTEPRKLLAQVKGLELAEMNDVETCCGFGGTFAVKFEVWIRNCN